MTKPTLEELARKFEQNGLAYADQVFIRPPWLDHDSAAKAAHYLTVAAALRAIAQKDHPHA